MPSWESGMTAWPVGVHLPTAPRFGSGGNGRPGTDAGRQGRISRFRVTEPPKTLGGCTLLQFGAEMQRIRARSKGLSASHRWECRLNGAPLSQHHLYPVDLHGRRLSINCLMCVGYSLRSSLNPPPSCTKPRSA